MAGKICSDATVRGIRGEVSAMCKHYTCVPLSIQQVIESARMLRRTHGVTDSSSPNLVAILQSKTIPTRFGDKAFHYWEVSDDELEGEKAQTAITPATVEIVVSKSTLSSARFGHGGARTVIARQLAHAVLHQNATDSETTNTPNANDDVRQQTRVFASHFLVSDVAVYAATSIENLAEKCLVDLDTAKNRWSELRGNPQQKTAPVWTDVPDIDRHQMTTCTACSRPTMFESGQKSFCMACARMADAYPDGDGPVYAG